MISSEQRYAEAAFSAMKTDLTPNTPEANFFGSICHQFPAMVRLNGLRLTAIYYQAKAGTASLADGSTARNKAYERYLKYLGQALDIRNSSLVQAANNDSSNASNYRMLTRQALAASVWFKRYAEAILRVEASSDPEGELK
ncbi:type III-B CRISPR module-associated protein Cmr5 [Paenibacillus glufosinatiresistens]|uniref:type III-B CRISPR module-associated protein Cmr5 n=1 Tax=Paenibacillus glufosinatiresistens TaxID=3070657 RepID=UPI00286E1708|nr:type III-B CRISPR module-associated protein Cmr5 [Paenibacillus sp. YX.27]